MIHARTGERVIFTEFVLLFRVTTLRLELYACVHSLRHRLYLLLKTAPPPSILYTSSLAENLAVKSALANDHFSCHRLTVFSFQWLAPALKDYS
jgi:hypothetical protein